MSAWPELERDPTLEALSSWADLRDFLATEPAKLIVREAANEARDAIIELLNCDPADRAKIAECQSRARTFHNLQRIVAAIMGRGEAAEAALEAELT